MVLEVAFWCKKDGFKEFGLSRANRHPRIYRWRMVNAFTSVNCNSIVNYTHCGLILDQGVNQGVTQKAPIKIGGE